MKSKWYDINLYESQVSDLTLVEATLSLADACDNLTPTVIATINRKTREIIYYDEEAKTHSHPQDIILNYLDELDADEIDSFIFKLNEINRLKIEMFQSFLNIAKDKNLSLNLAIERFKIEEKIINWYGLEEAENS